MVDPAKNSPTPVRTLEPPAVATKPSNANSAAPKAVAKKATSASSLRKPVNFSGVPFWAGLSLSILWIGAVIFAMAQSGGTQTFGGLPLVNWAIAISAIVSPIAMIWMVTAYLQRAADVQSVTEPLRRQLAMIIGESGAAEVRIRRFNQAVREQLELLRSTKDVNQGDLTAVLERVRAHREELDQFEQHSLRYVKEIQDVIRRSMQHIEQVMEDKFTMLRVLDGKLAQSGDTVSQQSEYVHDQISSLLHEIETNAQMVSSSLERAMQDSRKLADTARAQEASLLGAAETASTTIQELSSRIDVNIAHFLEHTGSARGEAEKLATVLDAQTRALDDFSNTLPARVSEAEQVLHGVADRLYASEQLAREQAVSLSDRLSAQVDNLDKLLDKFGLRFKEIEGTLQQKQSDLDGLVVRVSAAANDLAQQMDTAIGNLGLKADGTINRFAIVNDEAKRSTDAIASALAETAARYENATHDLTQVSESNRERLRLTGLEINDQLTRFEALHKAADQAGQDVQGRASTALQNMQQVMEKLIVTREATQSVGDVLTEKLRGAVDQNERALSRLNEAARMTIHAMGLATETLNQQQDAVANKTTVSENTIRASVAELGIQAGEAEKLMESQNAALRALLKETEEKLDAANKRLITFSAEAALPVQQVMRQIDESTDAGKDSLLRYADNMNDQLHRLQQFNARVGTMGDDLAQMTQDTLSSIEGLNVRFIALKDQQQDATRNIVDQISVVASKLNDEVGAMGDKTSTVVETLQKTAADVSQQTLGLQREVSDAGSRIQLVTSTLQTQAEQIKSLLQKQTDDLGTELSRAETRFTTLGSTLKQQTETAHNLLDRACAHFGDVTDTAVIKLEHQTGKLDAAALQAQGRIDLLSQSLSTQVDKMGEKADMIEGHAGRLAETSVKTLDHLGRVNVTLSATADNATVQTQKVMAVMDEASKTLGHQGDALGKAAESASALVIGASVQFGEQTARLTDTMQAIEKDVQSLSLATTSFASQAGSVRVAMDESNQKLLAGLSETMARMDATSQRLQETTATALLGADQVSTRYEDVSRTANDKMLGVSTNLFMLADKTETTLGSLGDNISKQVASLTLVGDQLTAQNATLTAAHENQREQMLALFSQIGEAHAQASDIAARTITHLTDTLGQIDQKLGTLSDTSQTAIANVRTASTGFTDQADLLIQHAQQAEDQARNVLATTSALQDQARMLSEALRNEGDRVGVMLSGMLDKLGLGAKTLQQTGNDANTLLGGLHASLEAETATLAESMITIADRQRTLTASLEAQRETMAGLMNRLAIAQDETASAAERNALRMEGSAQTLTRQIEAMETQTRAAMDAIQSAGTGIADKTESLGQTTQKAEEQVRALYAQTASLHDQAKGLENAIVSETGKAAIAMETVIGKLDQGRTSLQDVSQSAEKIIDTLGTKLSEKTVLLGENLRNVTDKQTTLSTSLDAQTQALSGLVTRLTLAQDETASASERAAMRLGDNTSIIVQHMDTIAQKADDAVEHIRDANNALGGETVRLIDEASKAETQVKTLVSTTSSMRDEARNIRESLQVETAQVRDSLGQATTQLNATVDGLKTQSQQVMGTLDRSIQTFTQTAESTGKTLEVEARHLDTMAQQATEKMAGVGERLKEHTKLIENASTVTQDHGRALATTAEAATNKLVSLSQALSDSDKTAQDILTSAETRLNSAKTSLQQELDQIAALSAKATDQITTASKSLSGEAIDLQSHLAASGAALEKAAAMVVDETEKVPAALDRSAARIDETRKTFIDNTASIDKAMLQTTDRYISTSGAVRDTLMDEAGNLANVADTANKTLSAFNAALADQLKALETGTTSMSAQQKDMVDQAKTTLADLAASNDRLAALRNEAVQTTEKLSKNMQEIETKATASTQRLAVLCDGMAKQIAQMAQTSERAEGQIVASSQGFRDQLERVKSSVQTQIDGINHGLTQITAQLERTSSALKTATTGTMADVDKISARFDKASKDAASGLLDRTAQMHKATEEVAKLLSGFGDQMDVLLNRLSTAGDGIKQNESNLVDRLQHAFTQIGSIADKLESSRVMANNVSDDATKKLQNVSDTVERQIRSLADGAQTVTEIVRSVGQAYTDQTQSVTRNVVDAQSQIISMSKSVEDMQQRTDRMRATLKLQGDDLVHSLEQILRQLSMAGDMMSDTVDGVLQQRAADTLRRMS